MSNRISEEILKRTIRCPHDLKCLAEEEYPLCSADSLDRGCDLFVKAEKDTRYHYKLPLGFGCLCICPTRLEIYERYNR